MTLLLDLHSSAWAFALFEAARRDLSSFAATAGTSEVALYDTGLVCTRYRAGRRNRNDGFVIEYDGVGLSRFDVGVTEDYILEILAARHGRNHFSACILQ